MALSESDATTDPDLSNAWMALAESVAPAPSAEAVNCVAADVKNEAGK